MNETPFKTRQNSPLFLVGLLGLLLVCVFLLTRLQHAGRVSTIAPGESIMLYCAAGMQSAVDLVVKQFEAETGVRVQVVYGGSGTLLSSLKVSGRGDLYLAADESYVDLAREQDLIEEVLPVCQQGPVILVAKGNPRNIATLADLAREDVKVALGNPEAASIGKLTRTILSAEGLWPQVEAAVRAHGVFKPTVNDLVTDVSIGSVDAAIVWDTLASLVPELDTVIPPALAASETRVQVAVLKSSASPTLALRFARYLTAENKGLEQFRRIGFRTAPGDKWADVPEITLFSGGVNRVSIDQRVRAFAAREGVQINTIYNGCGILVSQMKAGENPDAYFACDTSYMDEVYERFEGHQIVSETDMVLLVARGNPKNLHSLEDLAAPGVTLATCSPKYSALGGLTQRLFQQSGLWDRVQANITYGDGATADNVVVRVRTLREDAGIVYRANTIGLGDEVEVINLKSPLARAQQPIAVSKRTEHPQLLHRLVNALTAAEMRDTYESAGFAYRVGEPMPPR